MFLNYIHYFLIKDQCYYFNYFNIKRFFIFTVRWVYSFSFKSNFFV